jgi:uncharacterized BrkB/YihY/UPF0761 family membrane protein
MADTKLIWLIALSLALTAALIALSIGAYLLRFVVEDTSNSTTSASYGLRIVRALPGGVISAVGAYLLYEVIQAILQADLLRS